MKTINCKVKQFESNNGSAESQFIIETSEGTFFQSYNSIIVFKPLGGGKIQLDEKYWDYSQTTRKYRNQFLNETKKETEQKIASGVYELTNLN